jgi:hypothetical protein
MSEKAGDAMLFGVERFFDYLHSHLSFPSIRPGRALKTLIQPADT